MDWQDFCVCNLRLLSLTFNFYMLGQVLIVEGFFSVPNNNVSIDAEYCQSSMTLTYFLPIFMVEWDTDVCWRDFGVVGQGSSSRRRERKKRRNLIQFTAFSLPCRWEFKLFFYDFSLFQYKYIIVPTKSHVTMIFGYEALPKIDEHFG